MLQHLLPSFVCLFFVLPAFAGFTSIQPPNHVETWLVAHNVVRSAHGAQPLTWSTSLAMKAAVWASRCNFVPTEGVLSATPYGENIVAGTGQFPVAAAVDRFIADAAKYDPGSPDPSYTHWTQVVWKSTTQLGCATALCDGIFDPKFGKATLHVCLYNPAGNVVGDAANNVEV